MNSFHISSAEAGTFIYKRETTHSPKRKEKNNPMKPSAPFMSEKMNKGVFSPAYNHV